MEEYPSIPMERTGKILRRSVYTFLQNYQYFTTISAIFAFPFSAAILISQSLVPYSPLLPTIHNRLHALFDASGFPPSSELFTILNLKLSQTITSSILTLPFTLSFLLFAKTSIIQALNHQKPPPILSISSFASVYTPILLTHLCNSLLILSANATCFALMFLGFNFLEGFGYSSPSSLLLLSASGAVFYSILVANALIIANLALVSSGVDKSGGIMEILKACVLIRGRTATALALALPANMALAAVEALFQYRVVGAYYRARNPDSLMVFEGFLIAYLYAIVIVIDTIVSFVFFKSCKTSAYWVVQGRRCSYLGIEGGDFANAKTLEDLP